MTQNELLNILEDLAFTAIEYGDTNHDPDFARVQSLAHKALDLIADDLAARERMADQLEMEYRAHA